MCSNVDARCPVLACVWAKVCCPTQASVRTRQCRSNITHTVQRYQQPAWTPATPKATPNSNCRTLYSPTHLQDRQLQDLIALLLSAAEALVDVAVQEGGVHLEQLHLYDFEDRDSELIVVRCSRFR